MLPFARQPQRFAVVVIRALARRVPLRVGGKGCVPVASGATADRWGGHGENFLTGWSKERSRGRGCRRKGIAAGVLEPMGLTGAMG
jgi:hypothetical protein